MSEGRVCGGANVYMYLICFVLDRPGTSLLRRGAWAIFPGAQPTEQPRRVPKVAARGMTFS